MTPKPPSTDSLLWKYRDYLRRLARRRLGSKLRGKLDESDLVQEAMLQAHLAKEQFHGTTETERKAWFRAILENKLAGMIRRFSRHRRDMTRETSLATQSSPESAPPSLGDPPAMTSTPSVKAARQEDLARLAEALSSLPEDQRRAVEMHHLEGLAFAEIAARMGRSKTSVAGLVFRGVRGLRATLTEDEKGEQP
jgi:RNA polymerase sigma-70 factor, ECF subfamily